MISIFPAQIERKNFSRYLTILVIDLTRQSLGNFLSFLSSVLKFKQPAKKKARMDGEQNIITSLRRVIITRINRNSQHIVLEQWEPTYF